MQRPPAKIFFSYKHNSRDKWICDELKKAIQNSKNGKALRLIDDPLPGMDFDLQIRDKISEAQAVVFLWSKEASKAEWVSFEVNEARRQTKIGTFLKYPGVELPDWWPAKRQHIPLIDLRLLSPDVVPALDAPFLEKSRFYSQTVDQVIAFARAVQDGRIKQSLPPLPPATLGSGLTLELRPGTARYYGLGSPQSTGFGLGFSASSDSGPHAVATPFATAWVMVPSPTPCQGCGQRIPAGGHAVILKDVPYGIRNQMWSSWRFLNHAHLASWAEQQKLMWEIERANHGPAYLADAAGAELEISTLSALLAWAQKAKD